MEFGLILIGVEAESSGRNQRGIGGTLLVLPEALENVRKKLLTVGLYVKLDKAKDGGGHVWVEKTRAA